MYCKHCGASIDDDVLLCPYCDSENEKVAKKEQDAHIEYYDTKTKELKKIPDKIVNKSTQITLVAIAVGILVFLIVMVVVFAVSSFKAKTSMTTQDKHLRKLEELYEAYDYEKLEDYLDKHKLNGGSYDKYGLCVSLNRQYNNECEWLKLYQEQAKRTDIGLENLEDVLNDIFKELSRTEELRSRGFRYDEEKVVLYVEKGYMEALSTYAYLTDEEISKAVEEYSETADYTELAKLAKKRMETR